MKIVKVELIPVTSPLPKPFYMPETKITGIDSVILKLTTDTGLVGIADSGDTSTWYRGEIQDTMIAMIGKHIAPRILLGEDPRNIEKIVNRMDVLIRDNNQAKALVDFALHDLKGKAFGVPVYQLLGGRTEPSQKQGWVVSSGPAQQLADESLEALANGFSLVKLKIGSGTQKEDIEAVATVREAIGDDARLTVDVNGFWNYDRALKTMRKLDRYDLECVEQPLPYWDIEGLARLRGQISTPVFADESAQDLHHLKDLIDKRACDGFFIKMQKVGGLLKAQRWLTMARLADMAVMSGCMIGSGLEASPSCHLWVSNQWFSQFCAENIGPLTISGAWSITSTDQNESICLNEPLFIDGHMIPNEGPGFGIELNEGYIAANITKNMEAVSITA